MDLISRRAFLRLGVYGVPLAGLGHSHFIEQKWLRVRHLRLNEQPTVRLAHFTDLHYKGDRKYLSRVMARINDAAPDFACFTGDIVEQADWLPEALDLLSGITCPLYGVPGNHEYWSKARFADIAACFRSTGGDWLLDQATLSPGGNCLLEGLTGMSYTLRAAESAAAVLENAVRHEADVDGVPGASFPRVKRILLTHYPATAHHLGDRRHDLILAGHSHGGQVRLPFVGALLVPGGVEGYDAGLYDTPAGPLHVNVGIGTWLVPVRFLCRPEITIIEL